MLPSPWIVTRTMESLSIYGALQRSGSFSMAWKDRKDLVAFKFHNDGGKEWGWNAETGVRADLNIFGVRAPLLCFPTWGNWIWTCRNKLLRGCFCPHSQEHTNVEGKSPGQSNSSLACWFWNLGGAHRPSMAQTNPLSRKPHVCVSENPKDLPPSLPPLAKQETIPRITMKLGNCLELGLFWNNWPPGVISILAHFKITGL